jgi:hypothetical protein
MRYTSHIQETAGLPKTGVTTTRSGNISALFLVTFEKRLDSPTGKRRQFDCESVSVSSPQGQAVWFALFLHFSLLFHIIDVAPLNPRCSLLDGAIKILRKFESCLHQGHLGRMKVINLLAQPVEKPEDTLRSIAWNIYLSIGCSNSLQQSCLLIECKLKPANQQTNQLLRWRSLRAKLQR